MKRILAISLALCLLLCGCGTLTDGSYHNVTPHKPNADQADPESIHAVDYAGLCSALSNMTRSGTAGGIIYVPRYDQSRIESEMVLAVARTLREEPIAAYAVEEIQWELGTNSGQSAVAVNITYVHDRSEIRKIRTVADLEMAKAVIATELAACSTGVVLYLKDYEQTDFVQFVEDHADANPQTVMETPQVKVNIYPEEGEARVVELKFNYQTSRDALRNMQNQVSPIFASAVLYVSGDAQTHEKYSQLYALLMERFDYRIETSITPAYSLLRHGVGDAKAFAVVYAAMCQEAGLDCRVVSGTRWGEQWYWNMVLDEGVYYHVDLLRSNEVGAFHEWTDADMEGYVWDYSAYPADATMPTEGE